MSAALKKPPAPSVALTPEREALAAAIRAKAQHEADLIATWAGMRKLHAQIGEARVTMDNAQEALAAAQEAAATYAAETAAGKNPRAPVSLRDARGSYADAQDDYVTLKRAYGSLDATYKALQDAPRTSFKHPDVIGAARAVLKSELDVEPLLAEIRALQAELVKKRLVMCFLRGERVVDSDAGPDKDWFLPTTQCHFPAVLPTQWLMNPSPPWRSVFEALCEDATTELPPL